MSVSRKVVINTGNVLNLVEIKQKAGQNVTDELLESLQITVHEHKKQETGVIISNHSDGEVLQISRLNDDLAHKMSEEERSNLKIGIKIFVQNHNAESLRDCLDNVYKTLRIYSIETVILAYNPPLKSDVPAEVSNGAGLDGSHENSNGVTDGEKCEKLLPALKSLWNLLEEYCELGKIVQIGVADCDEACFKKLYSWSNVKPSIIQINLSVCCVVPPGLQAFCKDNYIQLLTHSDPPEIITPACFDNILDKKVSSIDWCVRYQAHIKCRGVLTIKGYITKVQLANN